MRTGAPGARRWNWSGFPAATA